MGKEASRRACICAAVMAVFSAGLYAQAFGEIAWKNKDAKGGTSLAGLTTADVLAKGGVRHVVVQFASLPSDTERAAMEADGLILLDYLGQNAFFARTTAVAGAVTTATKSGLVAASELKLDWKLHPMLLRGEIPAYTRFSPPSVTTEAGGTKSENVVAVCAIFHPDVDLQTEAKEIIAQHKGKLRNLLVTINAAMVWLPSSELQAFAMEDAVQWVEPPLPPMQPTNDSNRTRTQANVVQAAPYSLDGTGITVLVYDGGRAWAAHPDFGGRLHARDNSDYADHSTHVAGTIGSSGASNGGTYRGMAPAVTIESYGFQYDGTGSFLYSNPGDMESDYTQAVNTYGAVISNNSIGTNTAPNGFSCDWEGDYGATDMVIDAMVRGSLGAPMRIVWANGNERQGAARCGSTYHTTAPPACAKNHITVGALNSNNDTMTTFSSWGPADDGRLKPDISGPGCQSDGDAGVTSTMYNDGAGGYGSMCGTSMAAPTVTGLCALILQDYKVQFPGQPLPRNSTLKVLLAQNAVDLGTAGPDYMYGYGSVRVQATIDHMRRASFLEDSLSNAEQRIYLLPVTAGTAQLKATLAWDDVPGSPNVIPELVNDLDLIAIAPDGTTVKYPWTLDPATPSAAAVRTKADHLNNIEQVVVDQPTAGVWQIRVSGYAVPSGPQPFSLTTSPDLRLCASKGVIGLSANQYSCSSTVAVTVVDCDLDVHPAAVDTVVVNVASSSEPSGKSVTLTETAAGSAAFTGSIGLSSSGGAGVLTVANGDTVTATYVDADDGQGHTNVPVTWSATLDCVGPAISNVATSPVGAVSATVTLNTSEDAHVTIRYGTACGSYTGSLEGLGFSTSHSLQLTGLSPTTTYYFAVEAVDRVGNLITDNHGGACYAFTTTQRHNYFTQQFVQTSYFDLDHKSLLYQPNGSVDYYLACIDEISALPVDPAGSNVELLDDDSYVQVTLTGGKHVSLYGVPYTSVYVGSNGYITFVDGDREYAEAPETHFLQPRVSVLFDDLDPPTDTSAGAIKWKQTADALVVTWDHIPEFNATSFNTFQAVLYFDGQIRLAWNGVASTDSMVGLSLGGGVPEDYLSVDLSGLSFCPQVPGKAYAPIPGDGANSVDPSSPLQWTAGYRATTHNVYVGGSPASLVLRGSTSAAEFDASAWLAGVSTYYWRVDEVNSYGTTTGDVWQFSTAALPPDFDADGDVDVEDYGYLQACISGMAVAQNDPACARALLDGDSDVDEYDLEVFRGCFTGPGVTATANCLP